MSLRDKASKINFAALPSLAVPAVPAPAPAAADVRLPKTAPGLMMAQAGDQRSELLRRHDELQARVAQLTADAAKTRELEEELRGWEGAKAARWLDAASIVPSRWANRSADSHAEADFELLKQEIAAAGGNVQPVKVRPAVPGPAGEPRYELVYGHRRHRACLALGLPVLALIDSISDRDLFVEMDRENRQRKDLSPWEQGRMYRRALDEGLFPSNRKLAEAVGADLSNVGKALALAELPEAVVRAFRSPLELQYRFAPVLRAALAAEGEQVLERAAALAAESPRPGAREVLERLVRPVAAGGGTVPPPTELPVMRRGRAVGAIRLDGEGAVAVTLKAGTVPADRVDALRQAIEEFLAAGAERSPR